jgi:protease IV
MLHIAWERFMAARFVLSIGHALRWLWWLLDGSRRLVFNLLFLALLLALAWGLLRSGAQALQPKTALVLDFAGPVVEQRSGSVREGALQQLRGQDSAQIRLRDVLAVLDTAARDDNISHVVLALDDFAGSGLASLREIAAAIERFKASGKPVVAWGSNYDQRQYYLAAHANEVWLHPMGAVYVEGYGRLRNYYKDAFEKIGVTAHVLRVGKFKNAAENFSANAPSAETDEADKLLYDALWGSWTTGVEKARRLAPGSIAQGIAALPGTPVAAGGDPAKLALKAKLIDGLKTRDELRTLMVERGAADKDKKSFRQVSFNQYLNRVKPQRSSNAVGVVVAEGVITDGQAPGGRIGGLSTAELIRQARDDEHIKAVVLRVNSPGGSAFGSELVRRELELTRQAGKPVVVSMGDVAASGGYWIAMAADEVIADEATITGSIGVVAVLPTAQAAMDKLGIRTGGYSTTWLANAYDVRRSLDPRFATLIQSSVDHVYANFIALVAGARKTSAEKIDAAAQGRVWTGAQAKDRALVDRTGSLADALQAAASRAKLGADAAVQYVERPRGGVERVLGLLNSRLAGLLAAPLDLQAWWLGVPPAVARQAEQDLGWLSDMSEKRQPFAAAVHCLCSAP